MVASDPVLPSLLDSNPAQKRQALIKRAQESLQAKLITYTASPYHPFALLMRQDAPLFEDLLRSAGDSKKGYLMLTSPGGDGNAAEKLLMMCRERFTESFNVIIPDYAKSAGTMIALGCDKILMGYGAELGPIDPQIQTGPLPSPGATIPARSFIEGLAYIRKKIKEEGDPAAMYLPMLSQIRPEIVVLSESAINDSRQFAEKWLKRYMLRDQPEHAEKVAMWLSTGEKYGSHGKVIGYQEAKSVLRLNAEVIDKDSELWGAIWELYCRSIQFLQRSGGAKLFESDSVSLNMDIAAAPAKIRPPPGVRQPPARVM